MSVFFSHLFLFLLSDLLETLQHLHLVGAELVKLPEQPGAGGRGLEDVVGVCAGVGGGQGQGVRGVTIGVPPGLGQAGQHRQLTGDHHGLLTPVTANRGR